MTLPRRRPDVLTRVVANDTVLYHPQSHEAHVLTPFAAAVWQLCDGRTTVADAARELGSTQADVRDAADTLVSIDVARQTGVTRRQALVGTGVVGGGALLASVLAPTAAAAASGPGGGGGGGGPMPTTLGDPSAAAGPPDYDSNTSNFYLNLQIPAGASVQSFQYYASSFHGNATTGALNFFLVDAGDFTVVYRSGDVPVTLDASGSYTLPTPFTVGSNGALFGIHTDGLGILPYDDVNDSTYLIRQYEGDINATGSVNSGNAYERRYSMAVTYI